MTLRELSIKPDVNTWPEPVVEALNGLDDPDAKSDRRRTLRVRYCVKGTVEMQGAHGALSQIIVYTRDVNAWTIGFISEVPLPRGELGILRFENPDGREVEVECAVYRCRPLAARLFEGALHFRGGQLEFVVRELGAAAL